MTVTLAQSDPNVAPKPSTRRAGFIRIDSAGRATPWRMFDAGALIDVQALAAERIAEFPEPAKDEDARTWVRVVERDPEADFGALPAEQRERAGYPRGTFFMEEGDAGSFTVLAYMLGGGKFREKYEALRRARGRRPGRLRVFSVVAVVREAPVLSVPTGRNPLLPQGMTVTSGGIVVPG